MRWGGKGRGGVSQWRVLYCFGVAWDVICLALWALALALGLALGFGLCDREETRRRGGDGREAEEVKVK